MTRGTRCSVRAVVPSGQTQTAAVLHLKAPRGPGGVPVLPAGRHAQPHVRRAPTPGLERLSAPAIRPMALTVADDDRVTRRPVVLIVDDNAAVRRALRLILRRDFDVVEANGASRAYDILRRGPIDVALLDVDARGGKSVEALQRFREISRNLRVILLTAAPHTRTLVTATQLGALDYLTKPVRPSDLIASVRRAITAAPIVVIGEDVGLRASVSVFLRLATGVRVRSLSSRQIWAPSAAEATGRLIDLNGITDADPILRGVCGRPRLARVTSAVVQHVASHYATATVESIARAVSAAPGHLSEVFRADTGIGLKGYLLRVRVEVAGYLLRETREKQDTVAQRVGFCDAAHLSRWFRRVVGRTPGDYRSSEGAPPLA